MPNTSVRAATEGLPSITRRVLLRNTAVAGVAGAGVAVPATAAPQKLTPAERTDAPLEEIKDAILEMNPAGNCRIARIARVGNGPGPYEGSFDTVMVISNLSFLKPGEVLYLQDGKIVRREGGAA